MYLYRGYYDAIVQARYRAQQASENLAIEALATASSVGSTAAMRAASAALAAEATPVDPSELQWRSRLAEIWTSINASIGTEVLQGQDTDLNIAGIDVTLSDVGFLLARIATISQLSTEPERLAGIAKLLAWTDPGPGGFYDDLAGVAPHLERGPGAALDPDFYQTPYTTSLRKAPNTTIRLSWQRHALAFFDNSLTLGYAGLDRNAEYVLDVAYNGKHAAGLSGGLDESVGVNRLMANDEVLHDYRAPPAMMEVQSFAIAKSTTAGGTLSVRCSQPHGIGGTGRTCEIAEVWLRQVAPPLGASAPAPLMGKTTPPAATTARQVSWWFDVAENATVDMLNVAAIRSHRSVFSKVMP